MNERRTVLVVEDDPDIAALVGGYLTKEGFSVASAASGREALAEFDRCIPALVILDIGLPDVDGIEVCRSMRERSDVPLMFLTARDDEIDRIVGLELGADDYVTKPFSPRELTARAKAILRRSQITSSSDQVMRQGAVTVDLGRREVTVGSELADLTAREFDLLAYLIEHTGLALSRQQLLDGVWGYDWYGDVRTVDVHIAQLRKKLGDAADIRTVRGIGYRWA
ncbi:MAG: response regulator transcription factor [Actinobacteria bacterium]|nr:response regulator transcription factor [Actinomycetota bacterium]